MLQKFAGPLVGAPVRPNMLNMPKSASANKCSVCPANNIWANDSDLDTVVRRDPVQVKI